MGALLLGNNPDETANGLAKWPSSQAFSSQRVAARNGLPLGIFRRLGARFALRGDMHARELIELAGLVAAHGAMLIEGRQPIPAENVGQYWISSKLRLDRWARTLRSFVDQPPEKTGPTPRVVRGTLEEIFAGEVLTRVWTAVLCGYDRHRGSDDAEPLARNILLGHVEARHRALLTLSNGAGIDAAAAVQLNRLRRRAERWSDLLVGHLAARCELAEFAADPDRAREFAEEEEHRRLEDAGSRPPSWCLAEEIHDPFIGMALASLQSAFQHVFGTVSPNADLNARIGASVLGCFPAELFDGFGFFNSLWIDRLITVADEAQQMIDELVTGPRANASVGVGSHCSSLHGVATVDDAAGSDDARGGLDRR